MRVTLLRMSGSLTVEATAAASSARPLATGAVSVTVQVIVPSAARLASVKVMSYLPITVPPPALATARPGGISSAVPALTAADGPAFATFTVTVTAADGATSAGADAEMDRSARAGPAEVTVSVNAQLPLSPNGSESVPVSW